ncbi:MULTISPECIES: FadR/GntR family transcriptional regulator [Oceanobacillus]|uniref:GntR family transcriptional regulator n=1 Tax=Oceanobacillus indicireducens TaxID=1004261 RepID=A0A917XT31_9BACI|nr:MULTISPECIES: FadR/GntR family transcriptional regulator [Oceanobacillus]GGN52651.1 GntR family transcriptional regulator [Oceanobacillus indicireducens]
MVQKRLSDHIADDIIAMISIEKRFKPGDKLPNEIELSEELDISRTTLREAIRILVTNSILEIRRGKGTYVKDDVDINNIESLSFLADAKIDTKDLYEIRLIFEPEVAYLATIRASEAELKRIIDYGLLIEEKVKNNEDRTEVEHKFHKCIVKATHNAFMERLMPVIQRAIAKGVILTNEKEMAIKDTISDHRMIMDFMRNRNPEGARSAMKIHILHAMKALGLD